MIRRTVAVTVRVVVEASDRARFDRAIAILRNEGPPVSWSSIWSDGSARIDRVIQSHRVEVEPEKRKVRK